MTIGQKIKERREEMNLSQRALAKLCNVSQPTISAIESSTKAPSVITVSMISKALNVSLSDLIEDTELDHIDNSNISQLKEEYIKIFDELPENEQQNLLEYARYLSNKRK